MEEEVKVLALDELTEEQWNEVRVLAIKMHDAGQFGKNQMKCHINAFMCWLACQDYNVAVDSEEIQPFH